MHKSKDRSVPYKGYLGKLSQFNIPHQEGRKGIFVPEGLHPLIDELFGEGFPYTPKSPAETTPLHDYSGSNPILGKLSRQKRLLVDTHQNQVFLLLQKLLEEIPNIQIRIIVSSLSESKKLKEHLAGKGFESFYVEYEADYKVESNIRIAAGSRVARKSFDLIGADLVIFLDTTVLLDDNSDGAVYKNDLSMLFSPGFPTQIPSNANVLGFISQKLPLPYKRRLWKLFSINTVKINALGSVEPIIRFRMADFIHNAPATKGVKQPSNFELRKNSIWRNADRARFIEQIASDWINKTHQAGCSKSIFTPEIMILAENMIQLESYKDTKTKSIEHSGDVSTIQTLSNISSDRSIAYPSCCIRIDAGIGGMHGFNPTNDCLVIDIADKGLPGFEANYKSRLKAYRELGWVREGEGIFLNRWTEGDYQIRGIA
jgi:hypothetical protein